MIKILANDGIEADGVLLLQEAGYELDLVSIPQAELMAKLPAYDAIIVRSATKVRKELIDACPNLKIIARGGVGLDNIDVDYARSKGIRVISTPAASSVSVAELAIAHMFSQARMLHLSNREMPVRGTSEFKKLKSMFAEGSQLRGKTLGIVGFGRIGQEVARIALGIGMDILPVDPIVKEANVVLSNTPNAYFSVPMRCVGMDDMLAKADYITLHVPFTGKPLFSYDEFAKMKTGVTIINAARGGVVDEAALLAALESGKVAGAGLDVFENEPTPRAELMSHPKVSVSPHIGASTVQAQAQIGLELADRIIEYFGEH